MTDFITMAHGNGGATMQELIRDYFVEAFDNPILSQGEEVEHCHFLPIAL